MTTAAIANEKHRVEEGVWVLVIGELSVFTLLFTTFLYYRAMSPEEFEASRGMLHQALGAFNTIMLLTSSYFIASAVKALRDPANAKSARRLVQTAIGCGLVFVMVKIFEYVALLNDGVTLLTNDFFMLYFVLTGIHLMHLLVGLLFLTALASQVQRQMSGSGRVSSVFQGFSTSFWHMLDIVWVVLFPLLYLLH